MNLLTPQQWAAIWNELNGHGKMDLQSFAVWHNRRIAELRVQYPGVSFSNGRYAAHVEQALAAGLDVPAEIIASLGRESIQTDWPWFPRLAPLLGYGGAS